MTEVAVQRLVTRLTKRKQIDWSEGEANSDQEINERIAQRLLAREHLEALMQESPFMQEHVKVIPVSLDVTQHEVFIRNKTKDYNIYIKDMI